MKLSWEMPDPEPPRSRWGTLRLAKKGSLKLTHVLEIDYNFFKYTGKENFIRFVEDKARDMANEFWDAVELVNE